MEIKYDLGEADLLALTLYHMDRLNKRHNAQLRRRFAYLIGFALLALGSWLLISNAGLTLAFLGAGIACFAFYPAYWSWLVRRKVASAYRDPKNIAGFGLRTLRASEAGLEEVSALGETRIKWDFIDEVTEEAARAFVTVSNVPSMVIPKARIREGDYEGFIKACRAYAGHTVQASCEQPEASGNQ